MAKQRTELAKKPGITVVQIPSRDLARVLAAMDELKAKGLAPRGWGMMRMRDGGVSGSDCVITGKKDDFTCGDSDK